MFEIVNILDLIEAIGEKETISLLDDFESRDVDIENFVKNSSVDFAKKKITMTFVVFKKDDSKILGIFSLSNKILSVSKASVSKTKYSKLERYAKDMTTENTLLLPGILIAQFSKNDKFANEISGNELMEITKNTAVKAQRIIGGSAVFLECKNNEKILKFYIEDNNFTKYDERISVSEDVVYQQLLTLL